MKIQRFWLKISIVLAALFVSAPVLAWDAGPKKCVNNFCSGGALTSTYLETKTKYADGVIPGRLADCPAGYTNNGIAGCGRGASTYAAASRLKNCRTGYTNMGGWCGKGFSTHSLSRGTCDKGYKSGPLGRCYKICKAGYTNNGEFCGRGVSLLGPSKFICKKGERRGGGLIANKCFPTKQASATAPCSPDREEYGASGAALCFKKCPSGSKRTALATCSYNLKWRGNTHLYIVHQALTLLSRSNDPVAKRVVATMKNNKSCRTQWEKGLSDPDDITALLDDPTDAKAAGGSHFYNGGRRDVFGKPTKTVTYKVAGIEAKKKGNARQNAAKRISSAGNLGGAVSDAQCHRIGLALHYLTDMTQPMHATGFSGANSPLFLHPVLEFYAPLIQARYRASSGWDGRWKGQTADQVFLLASIKSGKLGPKMMAAIGSSKGTCAMSDQGITYVGPCLVRNRAVDSMLGTVLKDGYQSTASYLYALFNTKAGKTPVKVGNKPAGKVNGRNVAWVEFGTTSRKLGVFTQIGQSKRWEERGAKGAVFKFSETNRDEWSVYLRDNSRGVNIQLDLWTKKIFYSDKKTKRRPLYVVRNRR